MPSKKPNCVIKVKKFLMIGKNKTFFSDIQYIDVSSSLKNGGGPACLRFTIYLTKKRIS